MNSHIFVEDKNLGMIPANWEVKTLADVCEIKGRIGWRGYTVQDIRDSGPLVLGATQISSDNRLDLSKPTYLSREKFEESPEIKIDQGDILVVKVGNTIGKVAIVLNDIGEACINPNTVLLKRINIEPRFLFYHLTNSYAQNYLITNSPASAQPAINQAVLKSMSVPVPPPNEQRAIAEVLGALDDKIELNRRMNRTLESIAQALFKEWFVDNPEAEGWEITSLGELFPDKDCVLTGPFGSHLHAHDYRSIGTPILLVKNIMYGKIIEDGVPLVGDHKLPDVRRYQLEQGDIVFTRVGAVGRSAYIHKRHEGWLISGQTLRVRVSDPNILNSRYLAQVYLEPSFISMVESFALGTTRPSLNTDILKSFKFLLPPIELQNNYAELAYSLDYKIQNNNSENRTLTELRDTLLPRLMRGDVRVKDLA